ncbi:hypothetical protein C5Z26_06295 [Lactobacillus sp. CBA3606]|uniref:hypothetical protein n=1 Tax=Lactobacillus sp. CBA3606 TaxID=2099789 RepID=UPI000CFBFB31|nr:hypothetical protein [Lactobacillus sp. CBA3606]AVK63739.1 hypothetical protein C5Z26_06295 [Lactobacillus sp. CBA3606]
MKNLRGMLGLTLLLTLGLAGCQATTSKSFRSEPKAVQTTTKVTAVNKVQTNDYLGRWVSPSDQVALYLTSKKQLAFFQANHPTIKGGFTLKLAGNNQANLTQLKFGSANLNLTTATSMILKRGNTTIQLTKDSGWSPQHNVIPTDAKTALQTTALAAPAALKPEY